MAKKRKSSWSGNYDDKLDEAFLEMREAAQTQLNRSDIAVGSDAERLVVGLPLPSLALRYLMQSTVFPLSRILQIIGVEGTCKSALLYEWYHLHCMYGGGYVHIEAENKDSPLMRNSILEYNPVWMNRGHVVPAYSLEECQQALTTYTENFIKLMSSPGGPGRRIPVCIGWDSLTALDSENKQAQTLKDGFTSRGYSDIALLVNSYMQSRAARHREFPITIAATNHLKPARDARGFTIKNKPGGKSVDFMATHQLELSRAKTGADIDFGTGGGFDGTKPRQGLRLKLKAHKNSLGPSRRHIMVEFTWWTDRADDGTPIQRHMWDWPTASIEMLLDIEKTRKSDFKRIMDIVDLHPQRRHPRTVWSKALGIPKDQPASWHDAGVMLEHRPDLLEAIYPELNILYGYEFEPGRDYLDMKRDAAAAGAVQAREVYNAQTDA